MPQWFIDRLICVHGSEVLHEASLGLEGPLWALGAPYKAIPERRNHWCCIRHRWINDYDFDDVYADDDTEHFCSSRFEACEALLILRHSSIDIYYPSFTHLLCPAINQQEPFPLLVSRYMRYQLGLTRLVDWIG